MSDYEIVSKFKMESDVNTFFRHSESPYLAAKARSAQEAGDVESHIQQITQ